MARSNTKTQTGKQKTRANPEKKKKVILRVMVETLFSTLSKPFSLFIFSPFQDRPQPDLQRYSFTLALLGHEFPFARIEPGLAGLHCKTQSFFERKNPLNTRRYVDPVNFKFFSPFKRALKRRRRLHLKEMKKGSTNQQCSQ